MPDGELNLRVLHQWIATLNQRIDLLRARDCPLSREERLRELTHVARIVQTLAAACEQTAQAATKATLAIELDL